MVSISVTVMMDVVTVTAIGGSTISDSNDRCDSSNRTNNSDCKGSSGSSVQSDSRPNRDILEAEATVTGLLATTVVRALKALTSVTVEMAVKSVTEVTVNKIKI